mgnify:CR=1 FL=1
MPMACNWSFRQFEEVICSQYPWGLLDEVVYKYYDGENKWVTVSNDEELATMFARHKEKENFHVRLQIDVLEQAFGPRMAGATSGENQVVVMASLARTVQLVHGGVVARQL